MQSTSTLVSDVDNAAGWVIVALDVAVHPLVSVMVTEYAPIANPEMSCVVAPFDQLYVYGDVPPETVRSIEPLLPPLQITFTCVFEADNRAGSVMADADVVVQPLASVTVTV